VKGYRNMIHGLDTVTVYRDRIQGLDAGKGYRDIIHGLHGYRESRKGAGRGRERLHA
jgi:hypothetical protein